MVAPSGCGVEAAAAQQEDVEPAVVVVVEEGGAAAHRFEDVVGVIEGAVDHGRAQTRAGRDVDEAGEGSPERLPAGSRLDAAACHLRARQRRERNGEEVAAGHPLQDTSPSGIESMLDSLE